MTLLRSMPAQNQRKKKRSRRKQTSTNTFTKGVAVIILIGLIGGLGYSLFRVYREQHRIEKQKQAFQETITRLERKNSHLKELNAYLDTQGYKERKARGRQGNLKAKGETAVAVSSDIDTPSQLPNTKKELITVLREDDAYKRIKPETNPERWWAYFFDRERFPD